MTSNTKITVDIAQKKSELLAKKIKALYTKHYTELLDATPKNGVKHRSHLELLAIKDFPVRNIKEIEKALNGLRESKIQELLEDDNLDVDNVDRSRLHLFVINYDHSNKIGDNVDVLENLSNERPDWREYWPIRKYVLQRGLIDDHYYGFFSPKFPQKTLISMEQVSNFCSSKLDVADLISFSGSYDQGVIFDNIFLHGNYHHPGLLNAFHYFLIHISEPRDILRRVMPAKQAIFSNYFVAKGVFWKQWFELAEKLFDVAEKYRGFAGDFLRTTVSYKNQGLQLKVFLMERLCSYVISKTQTPIVRFSPLRMGFSPILKDFLADVVIADTLKTAFIQSGNDSLYRLYRGYSDQLHDIWCEKWSAYQDTQTDREFV